MDKPNLKIYDECSVEHAARIQKALELAWELSLQMEAPKTLRGGSTSYLEVQLYQVLEEISDHNKKIEAATWPTPKKEPMDIKCPLCRKGPKGILYVEKREFGYEFAIEADGHLKVNNSEEKSDYSGIDPYFECHNHDDKTGSECMKTWPVPEALLQTVEWD